MKITVSAVRPWGWTVLAVLVVAFGVVLAVKLRWSRSEMSNAASSTETAEPGGHEIAAEGEQDEHEDHAGHDEASSLRLSPQARRNIGLRVGKVELTSFQRTITVPAVVAERPGRTKVRVTAPLTGVITDVFAVSGQAVQPGDTLFVLRLTHEDLVQAQTEFLKTLEALDVENREIERLEKMTQGAVAGKVILERKYEKQKLEGLLKAQREALLLHGLSAQQVDEIAQRRRLLQELRIVATDVHRETDAEHLRRHHTSVVGVSSRLGPGAGGSSSPGELGESDLLVLQELHVSNGDFVQAGGALATFYDLQKLYIEGRAFEQDAGEIAEAARQGRQVSALPEDTGERVKPITGLDIAYLANQVETESRALHFYVDLPNRVIRDTSTPDGRRFLTWRFKPGQRMRLRVPVETWPDQIVLPVEAIADEGAETYVFVQNGDHFDRQPVHLIDRDQTRAVVANDGSIFPGDTVALNSAHQLQMALKNKAGGGVDPHAGHSH